jgi:hypothetical protein
MSAYLSMFKTLASEKLAAEDAVGIIKTARAHAGGKAKAEKALAAVATDGEDAAEFAEFFKNGHRLFIELGDSDLTDWMQITPGTGRWNHPKFGLVEITDATLERFVDNFKKKVYQEHIPVDAEHKTKLSGAFGYYRDMKVGHEGKPGVWAKIELTERGKELLAAGGFRYFSPEFYEEWEEPASGQIFQDVITGGAFTTRPFFKDKALEPVVMSEFCMPEMDMAKMEANEAADFVSDICEMVYDGFTDEQINNVLKAALAYAHAMAAPMDNSGAVSMSEGKETHVAETEVKEPQGFSEEQLRAFAELQTANETLSKQFSEALETNKALSSRVEAMETADRTRRFKEVVTGRGGANDGGPQWFGEPDKHVSMLNTLAKTFGEDSEEFNAYVESQNAAAKALADSPIMRETGSSSPEPAGGIEQKVDALVKQYMERDPKLTRETALPRVFAENPAVYAEYNKEFMAKAKKGE